MNNMLKKLSIILMLCLTITLLGGCVGPADPPVGSDSQSNDAVDYAASVKLDMSSTTAKAEVTVKTFVDGDTTHFNVPTSVMPTGVLKARYLGINTPESTGKIEEWGKKASRFTKEKLSNATSIVIESDTAEWNADSTGDRYLVWVWYKTADSEEYRNLNIEILQEGLAIASNSANNSYGSTCMKAINQAKELGLNINSGEKDPDFYYGDIVELTVKELRANTQAYNGMKVAFTGIVSTNNGNNSVYVEQYDPETDMYYGFSIYYGFSLSGKGLEVLTPGNEVRIVGSLQYYETGGTWQISDVSYREMKPSDPNNIQIVSTGHSAAYVLTDPEKFVSGKIDVVVNDEMKNFKYAELALSTSISMENLKVVDVYTTTNEESSSQGAMTLKCQVNGLTIDVRTTVFYDENGQLMTKDDYLGKTIDVKGIVDYFSGDYQIKVFSPDNIIVK
ncbi:MAG: thermonuclease family protein [Agathobacter sp.]|nr:thermonuclease family protein [Agathobacter sp.]